MTHCLLHFVDETFMNYENLSNGSNVEPWAQACAKTRPIGLFFFPVFRLDLTCNSEKWKMLLKLFKRDVFGSKVRPSLIKVRHRILMDSIIIYIHRINDSYHHENYFFLLWHYSDLVRGKSTFLDDPWYWSTVASHGMFYPSYPAICTDIQYVKKSPS